MFINKINIDISKTKCRIKGVIEKTQDRLGWLEVLSDEDLAFLKRFLLTSGSLKELAQAYGISYPTVRLRLDRLIEKVKIGDTQDAAGPFERQARALFADGRFDVDTLRTLLSAHEQEMEGRDEDADKS